MSVELTAISALLSVLGSGVVEKVAEVLKRRLEERGADKVLIAASTENIAENIEVVLSRAESQLGSSGVKDLTLEAIQAAHDAANNMRTERMRQARITFNAAIALTVIGVLIIFSGIALLLLRESNTAGVISISVGAVTEVISALLFRLNQETNNRLDEIGRDLSAIEAARIAMTIIERIGDPAKRDDAIMELAKDLRAQRNELTPGQKKKKRE